MDYDIAENRAFVHHVGSYRVREEAHKAAQRMHRLDALQFVFVILMCVLAIFSYGVYFGHLH
jgi:hypothetical protein